jgi:hypothetical protein
MVFLVAAFHISVHSIKVSRAAFQKPALLDNVVPWFFAIAHSESLP